MLTLSLLEIQRSQATGRVNEVTDHDVIEEVATRIWHIEKGRIEDFRGPYAQYLAQAETAVT